MSSRSLTKSAMAVLGCAGAAISAPVIVSYLATLSLPFFGAVLAGVITNEKLREKLVEAIGNTAAGFMTEIGGHFATDKIPRALSMDHNFHLERMLATAYFKSLEAIEKEFNAGEDEKLKEQAAQIFPSLNARIERGLKEKDLSALFLLQTSDQTADMAFANRFSAENVTLLIADEEKWREQLGDEVEIALRRWLNEEYAARQKRFLPSDDPLPEPLCSRLRAAMPHGIAHQISELVKLDEFKESWIAFQRAHLQGIGRVVERIETSQEDIRESVDALAQRIKVFTNRDELVAALADKLQGFLSQTSLPLDELEQLFDRQSEELRGLEQRLIEKIAQSTERLSIEGKENAAHLSEKIELLDKKVEEAILQDARRVARNRLKQLPAPPRDFTGRVAELEELRQALRQGGATISGVQGMGGVGKTALALVLADEFKDLYPDAQIYLDLKGVSEQPLSPAEVMWHVVSSFHPDMKRPDDADLPAWYLDLLNRHRTLLLYDNVRNAAQLEPLLPPRHCLLLVTSRWHFTVPGMFDKNLEELTGADAERLLLEIAPRIGADAAAIAKQCGYLPLALRLAASALHKSLALSPSDLLLRLQDKRKRVELIAASFSLSYELLSKEMQRRWRMLAIFPTSFDAPAAAAVWWMNVEAAKDSLAELEEYSLLDWEEAARRYILHDLSRDLADTRLSATERERAGLLHATHYAQLLSTAGDLYSKGNEAIIEGLSLFDAERVNIEAGQKWASARFADDDQAAHLCDRYTGVHGAAVLSLRQHPRDSIRWEEVALHAARKLSDRQSEGAHLGMLGNAYWRLGEVRAMIDCYQQALAISREIGARHSEAASLGNLGNAYESLGEFRTAIDYYQQSLDISRETGDREGESIELGNLGLAYSNSNDLRTAIGYYQQALFIAREIGNRLSESQHLGNLGLAYAKFGRSRTAIDYHQQSLLIAREIGYKRGESSSLSNLGLIYIRLGKIGTAIDCHQQALAIAREIDDKRGEGTYLGNLGVAYVNFGEIEKAIECTEVSVKIFEEIESPYAIGMRQNLERFRRLRSWQLRLLRLGNIVRGWLEELRGKSG